MTEEEADLEFRLAQIRDASQRVWQVDVEVPAPPRWEKLAEGAEHADRD